MSHEAVTQSKRILEFFETSDGQQLYSDLGYYAEWIVRRSGWSFGRNSARLPNGQTGVDVLHEAVLDATSMDSAGDCLRNIPSHIPLEVAFKQIIRSKVSHTFEASENKKRSDSITLRPDGTESDAIETDKPLWQPEGDRMSREERALAHERCKKFIEFARSDRIVYGMLVLLRDENLDKPAETVAARLGVALVEIYTARKRLATLVKKFEETAGGQKR